MLDAHRSSLDVAPRRLLPALVAAAILLTLVSLLTEVSRYFLGADHWMGFLAKVNLDTEQSVPAWFSSMLFLLCALVAGVITIGERARASRFATHWWALVPLLVLLSAEEIADVHMLPLFSAIPAVRAAGGFVRYTWIVLAAVALPLLGLVYLRWLAQLPRRTRIELLLAVAIYLLGAVGLEGAGGMIITAQRHASFGLAMVYHLEEICEMAGQLLALRALLGHLAREGPDIVLRFAPPRAVTPRVAEPEDRAPTT